MRLKRQLDYMRQVEMAVVVSEENGEEEKFAAQGLDIKPHRERMEQLDEHGHDIEYNFKDPDHPLQLVFVCAMWLTGFDAPTRLDAVPRQADEGSHPDADHRPRQPGDVAQDQRGGARRTARSSITTTSSAT